MGWNSTVVVMNDALGDIERDPDFGKKFARAVIQAFGNYPQDVAACGHCNAATVLGSHHADETVMYAIGGNYGTRLHHSHGWAHHEPAQQERLCREWADKLGFRLVRKTVREAA